MKLRVDFVKSKQQSGPLAAIEIFHQTGKLFMLQECVIGETTIVGNLVKGTPEDVELLTEKGFAVEQISGE